jgi:leader peptidase (prepilin peptidase)/N-methyltransferase
MPGLRPGSAGPSSSPDAVSNAFWPESALDGSVRTLRADPGAFRGGIVGCMEWVVGVVYAGFLAGSGILAMVDARTQRLPDKVMFPLYAWGVLGLTLASWVGGEWWRMIIAVGAAVLCYGMFWLLWFFGPMGFGDVKLVGVLGFFLGWVDLPTAMAGLLLGMLVACAAALGGMALRRVKRKSMVAFGPYLIAGAWVALAAQAVAMTTITH